MRRFAIIGVPNRRFRSRMALTAVLGLMVLALGFPSNGQEKPADIQESERCAAVIVGILRYTEWERPHQSFVKDAPLRVCTWGDALSAISLENNNSTIEIRDRRIEFRRLTVDEELAGCPVVVWGSTTDSAVASTLTGNTLIICDDCDQDTVNPAVNLVKVKNRIQFEINLNRAKAVGINFKSDLLDLARHVEGL